MPSRSDHVQALSRAGALINIALEDESPHHVRRGAVRTMIRAIRGVVDDDALWSELLDLAYSATVLDTPQVQEPDLVQLTERLADLMTEHQAALLIDMGYRTPPPPKASRLIDRTRAAIAEVLMGAEPRQPLHRIHRVEAARSALQEFTDDVLKHLTWADDRFLHRTLGRGRRVMTAVPLLYLIVSGMEVKTGEDFGIDFGTSLEHPIQAEITIPWEPRDLAAHAAAATVLTVTEYATVATDDTQGEYSV